MKFIIQHNFFILIFLIVWCILNENFSLYTIVQGFFLSILSLIISNKLVNQQFNKNYKISFFVFFQFIIILIISIYKSTFICIKLIITDDIKPRLVHVKTDIKNDWARCLMANAITLTPGTVTVDKNNNSLTVLAVNINSKNLTKADYLIKGHFEKILCKGDKI